MTSISDCLTDCLRDVCPQVALRLLLECALDQQETQFILLSPQDVDSIQHAIEWVGENGRTSLPEDFTKLIRMAPPSRDVRHER